MPTIGVDFDGTLVNHCYPAIGDVVPLAFEYLHRFQNAGARLILLTMRHDQTLAEAVEFCRGQGVEFWAVNDNPEQTEWTGSRKVYAERYIDDAAVGCPLVYQFSGDRPCVDWGVVGPMVLAYLGVVDDGCGIAGSQSKKMARSRALGKARVDAALAARREGELIDESDPLLEPSRCRGLCWVEPALRWSTRYPFQCFDSPRPGKQTCHGHRRLEP